jgi:putative ABC transport system permease protein
LSSVISAPVLILAAVAAALRAGRLSATAAIAAGRAPRSGRGFAAHRLLGRLPATWAARGATSSVLRAE